MGVLLISLLAKKSMRNDMKDIDEQINEVLRNILMARHETNFYSRTHSTVIEMVKKEIPR